MQTLLLPTEQRATTRSSDGDAGQKLPINISSLYDDYWKRQKFAKNFDNTYFTSGNYEDYLKRQEKYEYLACEIADIIGKVDNKHQCILDYGCGVGFLTAPLSQLIKQNIVVGYDISEWAINYGLGKWGQICNKGNLRLTWEPNFLKWNYDVTIILDVLEHMEFYHIESLLYSLKTKNLIVRIPVCLPGEHHFHLEVSQNDPTHITCMSKMEWTALFDKYGFKFKQFISEKYIWDSPGVLCAIYEKDN